MAKPKAPLNQLPGPVDPRETIAVTEISALWDWLRRSRCRSGGARSAPPGEEIQEEEPELGGGNDLPRVR